MACESLMGFLNQSIFSFPCVVRRVIAMGMGCAVWFMSS